MTTRLKHAVGIFPSRQDAESTLQALKNAGFPMDKVSVIAQNATADQPMAGAEVKDSNNEQIKGGAGAGAVAGTATGGLMGLIGSLGVLAIPGVGPAAEVGIVLANTLLGSGIGAAGGGLVGALIGWGVPEDQARYYNDRVSQGEYLVIVEGTEAEIHHAETILNQWGIQQWNIYDTSTSTGEQQTRTISRQP